MTKAKRAIEPTDLSLKAEHRIGCWAAILMIVFTGVAFAIAITTPPISGPFCRSGCVSYPYSGVASYVPHDYVWLYPALFIAPLFLILAFCIHHDVSRDKRIFSQIGLSFALAYTILLTLDYYIQITVIQPSLLRGETEGLALFLQYNPHGIFIAFEDLGYLMLSISFFFIAMALTGEVRIERTLRWILAVSSLLGIGSYIVLTAIYGDNLEYRFEVLIITINWITLIIAGIFTGILFSRTPEADKEKA